MDGSAAAAGIGSGAAIRRQRARANRAPGFVGGGPHSKAFLPRVICEFLGETLPVNRLFTPPVVAASPPPASIPTGRRSIPREDESMPTDTNGTDDFDPHHPLVCTPLAIRASPLAIRGPIR